MPTLSLVGHVPGFTSRALAPRPIRGLVDECALAGARHAPPLPACGLGSPDHGVWTATGAVGFACALEVTVCGLDERACALWATAGSAVIVCDHAIHATGPNGHGTGRFSPLTGPGHRREVGSQDGVVRRLMVPPRIAATLGCGWSLLLQFWAAPSLSPSLLCRTSPCCSSACWGSVNSGMCFQLLPVQVLGRCLVPVAAPSACLSARVSAPGESSPAGVASATGSPSRRERFRESSRSERRRRCSSSGERSQSGKKHRGGRSPSPARSSRLARSSASSSSASLGRSLRRWPAHLARWMVVVLPPLLRVRGMTTALVPSIPSTWIGVTPFGLFFASSRSSKVWRNRQV